MKMKGYPKEFTVWLGMIQRCFTEANASYNNYGGRGITVCDRWKYDFLSFIADMGSRPSDKHSIERLDNDGDYSPENCTWATPKEQARNRRSTVNLTIKGETKCLEDWVAESEVDASTIRRRMKTMSHEDAVFSPSKIRRTKYIEANGKRLTLDGWAEELNLSRSAIERRLNDMTPDNALRYIKRTPNSTAYDKRVVQQFTKGGDMIGEYESLTEAGKMTGVNFRNISAVCNGQRKTTGGYVWGYKS